MTKKRKVEPAKEQAPDIAGMIRAEFGNRIKVTNQRLSVAEAEEVLARSGEYQFYKDLPQKEIRNLSLNLLLDDGIFPAVVLDESMIVLDGHQRLAAFVAMEDSDPFRELPVRLVKGLAQPEKVWLVRSLNDNRRHLSARDKQLSIARCLDRFLKQGKNPSDRFVAGILAVDHKTVANARRKISSGKLAGPRMGTDGKSRRMPTSPGTAWQRLKGEYSEFQKPGKLFLVIDDLTSSRVAADDAKALAKLADHLLTPIGAILLLTTPSQAGELILNFAPRFDCRWVWPVLLPQHLVDSTRSWQSPPTWMALFLAREESSLRPKNQHIVYDLRKHAHKKAEALRLTLLERMLSDGLGNQLPHIHVRSLGDRDLLRLAEGCGQTLYDMEGRPLTPR